MKRLTFDEARTALPALEELRPLVDHLLATSEADEERAWAGSGELGTSAGRLVSAGSLDAAASDLLDREYRHLERVFALASEAIARLEAGNPGAAAESLLEAAALEERRNRGTRAAEYASAAYRIARDEADPRITSRALRRLARARRAQGRFSTAARDYANAWEIAVAVGDRQGAAEAAVGAGNAQEDGAHWAEAEEWYRRALEGLGEDSATAERWHALLNLHVVQRSRGDLEPSLESLRAAEVIASAIGDETAQQFTENAWGQWHMARGDFQQAESRLRSALSASTSAQASVTIRLNLGETLLAAGRHLDAAEETRRAEREALVASLPGKLPEVYRLLGRIAATEGNPDAFVLFAQALEIIDSNDLPDIERARTLQAYAEAEVRVGDPDTARNLSAEAEAVYLQLGLRHQRSEWADHHGPPSGTSSDQGNEDS